MENKKGYPLVDSGMYVDSMFLVDAKIYLTHINDVYLSEWLNGEDLREKQILCLFNRRGNGRGFQMLSNEIVNSDIEFTTKTIDEFAEKYGLSNKQIPVFGNELGETFRRITNKIIEQNNKQKSEPFNLSDTGFSS